MDKGPDAFRTISEVAEDLDLPQHVLRFWETRFTPIRPLKRGGGRRYYRPDDVDLLKGIRHLLYGQGYTIKGVQRILKEDGLRYVQAIGRGEQPVLATEPEEGDLERAGIADPLAADGHRRSQPGRTEQFGGAHPSAPPHRSPTLDADDATLLRGVLRDLLECRQILDALKAK